MDPFHQLARAQALFVGSHILLCIAPLRTRLVGWMGEGLFRLLYSLLSIYLIRPLPFLYWSTKHQGPMYWLLPWTPLTKGIVMTLASLGVVGIVAALLQPSPGAVVPGKPEVRGVLRITRHPMMMGIAALCVAHLLAFGFLSDVLFFGGMLVLALVGAWHQDRRKLRDASPELQAFYQQSGFWPLTTPGRLQGLREMGPLPILLGGLAAWGLRWAHRYIP